MHKISKKTIQDLAAELIELCMQGNAESILQKASEVYEQSVILTYLERQPEEVPTIPPEVHNEPQIPEKPVAEEPVQPMEDIEQPEEEVEKTVQEQLKDIMEEADAKLTALGRAGEDLRKKELPKISMDEEWKETVNADMAADLFERAEKIQVTKKSLNERLSQAQIQVGLNDRIAFVKHLFDGSMEDFNRVLSQLNSFETEKEAKRFLNHEVKPDYNWETKEEYLERFIQLIERKFL